MTESSSMRTKFLPEDDNLLMKLVEKHGRDNWIAVSEEMKYKSARQCRERYVHYLSPELTNKTWTKEEDGLLKKMYMQNGPKWSSYIPYFPGRSAVNIKNRWATLSRRLKKNSEGESDVEEPTKKTEQCYDFIINSCFSGIFKGKFDIFSPKADSLMSGLIYEMLDSDSMF